MKTFLPKVSEIPRNWFLVDAKDQVLGRMASAIAVKLMGKDKAYYTAFLDTGDYVVVVNAEKIKLTGKKLDDKFYYSHSGYPGGIKEISARDLQKKHPERLVQNAVKGMLPKNKLGKKMFKKLKVYRGTEHPHEAQNPQPLAL